LEGSVPRIAPESLQRQLLAADHETNYYEMGNVNDEPIILLHGSGPGVSAWANWFEVLPALGAAYHVYAPDMAGFGDSEYKPSTTYGIKLWVEQLFSFMDALGLSSATLIGNSFGGGLSLAATLKDSARVDRLVLLGTPAGTFEMTDGLRSGWDYEPDIDSMRTILRKFPYDQSIVTEEMVRSRYEASARPGAQDAYRKLIPQPSSGSTPVRGVPESSLQTITKPTLVVHGREDRVIPLEIGLRSARNIPTAEFHVFGQCGHWVQLERREAFLDQVQSFIRHSPVVRSA
jgi:2-hydroxy-6-oxo-octa-2,4-dienoate hydrolase